MRAMPKVEDTARDRHPIRLALSIQGAAAFAGLPARATLQRWITAALDRDARVTLRFVGAAEARHLNRLYRRKDYAPNVLTFDYARTPVVVADIVLCVAVVRREARAQGKPLRDHIAHLVVHGTLHALGYDHRNKADARRMERCEVALLARLGIPNPYEPR